MGKTGDKVIASFLGLLTLIMFLQVVFRYLFNNSLTWSEELAKFIFIWITFLGSAICLRDKLHLKVDFLVNQLPSKYKMIMETLNTALITVFSGVMTVIGFLWVVNVSGTLSPAMGLPLNIVFYSAFPVSTALTFAIGVSRLIKEIKRIKSN